MLRGRTACFPAAVWCDWNLAPTPHPQPTVERCLSLCGYVPGCNAAVYCDQSCCRGCKAVANASLGECTLLSLNTAMAPATPSDTVSGFVSAVILGPLLPPNCAGLHRRACEVCAASKDPAGCADCTRRAANEPMPDAFGGVWEKLPGAHLPSGLETHVGCARCANESAAPGVCAACLRAGPGNSSCWG